MAKVMISLPEDLLERIDDAAEIRETTRSGFLQEAAERQLERPTVEQIRQAMREGAELIGEMGEFDPTQAIRDDRDNRKY